MKVYNSVFDVIKEFDPNSPYLRAREYYKKTGMFSVRVPDDSFQWVDLGNGLGSALPIDWISYYYFRGENDRYEKCESSRSRSCKSLEDKVLADLKVIEFELALKQFPQVYLAEKDGMHIDYFAMAQHYGLNTDYLDITSDIGVAAFFACTKFNSDGSVTVNNNEYAQIRVATLLMPDNPLSPENKLHIFGLQPFLRPSRQRGSCLQLADGEDFAKRSLAYVFKTNPEDSLIIINTFTELTGKKATNRLWLFPDEIIDPVADIIKSKKCISDAAIDEYCSRFKEDRASIISLIDASSYSIIYEPTKWISDEEKNRLEVELTPYPYGKNKIATRLCFKPKIK